MSAPTQRRPPGPPKGKRRASQTEINERRAKALTMRNAGATYDRIATQLGIPIQTVQSDISYAMKKWVRIPAEQMVERQRAIHMDIIRVEYPAALDPSSPRHYQAIDRVLEVLRDERRLFGLDAPQKVSLGISEEEFARQAAELLKVTGERPLRELARLDDSIDVEVVDEEEEPWSNL